MLAFRGFKATMPRAANRGAGSVTPRTASDDPLGTHGRVLDCRHFSVSDLPGRGKRLRR